MKQFKTEVVPVEVLSAELVQRLARWRGDGRPVVSVFLNVDGKRNVRSEDYTGHLEALIRENASGDRVSQCAGDIEAIRDFVENTFERGSTRGLAIFSSGDQLWTVIGMNVPVDDQMVVNDAPQVRALEGIVARYESVGVLLTDRQRARLLVIEMGKVVERSEVIDPLPRHDDDKGDWRKDHVKAHASATAQHHLKNAADQMFEMYKNHPFEHLIVCVAEDSKAELDRFLHGYLRPRVIGHLSIPVASSDDEVVANARELVQQKERHREAQYVERLRAGVVSGAPGDVPDRATAVAGLDSTLRAIFDKRVDTLLVSEGYTAEGWRCRQCRYIATVGRTCAICNAEMTLVHDVIEEAVEDALAQRCHVEFCAESADLDVMGQIGALLRF